MPGDLVEVVEATKPKEEVKQEQYLPKPKDPFDYEDMAELLDKQRYSANPYVI